MNVIDTVFDRLGFERKAKMADVVTPRSWPTARTAYSGQDLPSDVAAYRYTVWTYICVKTLAQDIAGLPLKFYAGQGKDKREMPGHYLATLFSYINPRMSPYEFWLAIISYYLLAGHAWAALEFNNGGKPAELYPLRPDRITIVPDPVHFFLGVNYRLQDGTQVQYPAEELLWIKNFNPENEYYGLSPVEPLHPILSSDINARNYERDFFKNDATPAGALIAKGRLKEDARKRLIDGFEERHMGTGKGHRMAVLEGDWDFKEFGKSPKDIGFRDLRKMTREEILAAWGIPPAVVGIHEYSNYANAEVQLRLYWTKTVIPVIMIIESHLNSTFIGRYDPDLWCAFDLSQVEALQENQKDKATVAVMLHDSGIKTANEIRAEFYNMPPHPDGDSLKMPAAPLLPADVGKSYQQKAMDRRLERWAAKDLHRRRHELAFMRMMNGYFDEQGQRLLKRLKEFPEGHTPGKDEVDILFQELDEKRILADLTHPLITAALEASGQAAIEEIGGLKKSLSRKQEEEWEGELVGVFDLTNPRVAAWIEKNVAKYVTEVSDTTKARIREILGEAQANGWSIRQLADRLGEEFGKFGAERSLTIAQTEMGAAMNAGAWEGYRQGGAQKKEWLSTPDEKTRESHRIAGAADPIDIDEKFKVGNDYLDFPGDPGGSPEEIINCRCAVGVVVD